MSYDDKGRHRLRMMAIIRENPFFICSADGCNRPSDSGIMVILSDDSGNGWDDGNNIGRDR
ncbi:hypothetical protein ACIXNJ_23220 [Bacteroides fragilis]